MWLWILVTVIFMVGGMTLFTWYYHQVLPNERNVHDEKGGQHKPKIEANGQNVYSYFGSSMIYVINVMANQGIMLKQHFIFVIQVPRYYAILRRTKGSISVQFLSHPSWFLAFRCHGFGQFLRRHCDLFVNCAQNEATCRNVGRFGN